MRAVVDSRDEVIEILVAQLANEAQRREEAEAEADELRDRMRLVERSVLTIVGVRVTYRQAIAGVPEFGLPPIPVRTLRNWKDHHPGVLGVKRDTDACVQRFLVRGLLALHANPRRGTHPPQRRAKDYPAASGRSATSP